ncbi:MAG: transposase zinc-binding domain-containing protein [Burkholderiaceae bacterium]|nr:transposase zinc-binding domain-containing protein [Burkholderiaceae bacterium]
MWFLAHGFLRLRCGEYRHDKLLAFSCKRRGLCPSCSTRRTDSRCCLRTRPRAKPDQPMAQSLGVLYPPVQMLD